MLGLLSTIIWGREQADQKSATHGKIALAHEHNWALTTSTCTQSRPYQREASRPSGPARAVFFKIFLVRLPPLRKHKDWVGRPCHLHRVDLREIAKLYLDRFLGFLHYWQSYIQGVNLGFGLGVGLVVGSPLREKLPREITIGGGAL